MNAAMHVAHGIGLPVPLVAVKHHPVKRTTSAPPFLRRTAEELAALDAGPVLVVAPKPKPKPKPRASQIVPITDELTAQIAADYTAGASLAALAAKYRIRKDRIRRHIAPLVTIRASGGGHAQGVLDPDLVLADWHARMHIEQIARKYHADSRRVSRLLRELGVTINRNGRRK